MSPVRGQGRVARGAAVGVALLSAACAGRPTRPVESSPPPAPAASVEPEAPPPVPVTFTDVTDAAGLRFEHVNGARGQRYLPETLGSGVAFLDYDGDGRLDLFFVNSTTWEKTAGPPPTSKLYRNRGDGTFEDVTAASGLGLSAYGMGVTYGDMDSDDDPDVFVTCLGADHLFRNDGGRFRDVTAESGIVDEDFGSSATWVDHDKDGDLDVFVGNYVQWTREGDIHCTLDGKAKSYCTPESYQGVSPRLWLNDGGRFTDVTRAAGLFEPTAKALGVVAVDYDEDSWTDLVVANDTQPNMLFRNKGDGTFVDEGLAAGIAYDEAGAARGAMGIDAGDLDGSGRPSLVIGNFSNEMLGLYHNAGRGLFVDVAPRSNVGKLSLLTLAFGCFFFDYDRDAFPDIYVANGHLEPEIEGVQPNVTYEQSPHLFRNLGGGRFSETTAEAGADFARPRVARGAAHGDYDLDGDLDVVVAVNGGRARLFRNDGGNARHWISLLPRGTKSNRDGYGAVVKATSGGRTQTAFVKAGSSYLSQSGRAASFGLGEAARVDVLRVAWPSGQVDEWKDVPADRHYLMVEGKAPEPLAAPK